MKTEYFSADKARQVTKDAQSILSKVIDPQTLSILDQITKAAESGKSQIEGSSYISGIVKTQLDLLGYEVKIVYDQRDGNYYTISW